MPELPEVETVRRMLEGCAIGRRIVHARVSRHRLRDVPLSALPARLRGRAFAAVRRTGKLLVIELDAGLVLLSHLGMSGRWLHWPQGHDRDDSMPHVHLRLELDDGSGLWFEDARRFGMLRMVRRSELATDPSVRSLGPDPLAQPPTGDSLRAAARRSRVAVKNFLLDQKRIAGLGNIYVSEVLHRALVDPRRRSGALGTPEWERIAREIPLVLEAAIARMGTTISTFRNVWNEPGQYGEQLLVYDRAGQPCRRCGGTIRRIVQAGRSTFFCADCLRKPGAPSTRARPR